MRCPVCARVDDKVVDSRLADDGAAIRRRRECLACGRRFTTFERIEESALVVVKRDGTRQPFHRSKIVDGMRSAAKNRPLDVERLEAVAGQIEESLRMEGPEVTSERIGSLVLGRLRALDEVAYVRFASVYKGFAGPGDFEREIDLLTEGGPGTDPA
jgi:transcriptional repressor NrdR